MHISLIAISVQAVPRLLVAYGFSFFRPNSYAFKESTYYKILNYRPGVVDILGHRCFNFYITLYHK